jgi:hypothetical protein
MSGLLPPRLALATGERVCVKNKHQLWCENKAKQINIQEEQDDTTYWLAYCGDFDISPPPPNPTE